jgi:hypothetical protein
VILEVIITTEEQKTERARKQKEKKDQRNMSKEEEHEIKEKYRPRAATKTHKECTHDRRTKKSRKDGTRKV